MRVVATVVCVLACFACKCLRAAGASRIPHTACRAIRSGRSASASMWRWSGASTASRSVGTSQ
eukprot:15456623-Alexandrium_andersonii.AAC.1